MPKSKPPRESRGNAYGSQTRKKRNALLHRNRLSRSLQPPNVFVLFGHGEEDTTVSFDDRETLPDNYTLITLAQCGAVTQSSLVEKFVQSSFTDDLYAYPKDNKKIIEGIINNSIHIYNPGQKIPSLKICFFLDWIDEKTTSGGLEVNYRVAPSGVYTLPLQQDKFTPLLKSIPLDKAEKSDLMNKSTFSDNLLRQIGEVYSGSIYPPLTLNKNRNKLRESVTFTLPEVLHFCGPGIYYYIVCRNPQKMVNEDTLGQFITPGLYNRIKTETNIFPLLNNIITQLEPLAVAEQANVERRVKGKWSRPFILNTPGHLRKLHTNIRTIRSRSINQQNANANTNANANANANAKAKANAHAKAEGNGTSTT